MSQLLSDGGPFLFVGALLGLLAVTAVGAQCIGPLRSRALFALLLSAPQMITIGVLSVRRASTPFPATTNHA